MVVTLALAVGATTAVGSLLNATVLRQLAVPSPEQLVALSATDPRGNVEGYFYASPPSYFDLVGARAVAGRFFNDSDDAVVVISEAYRRRILGDAVGVGEAIKRAAPGHACYHPVIPADAAAVFAAARHHGLASVAACWTPLWRAAVRTAGRLVEHM